jgi:hypothetical protein
MPPSSHVRRRRKKNNRGPGTPLPRQRKLLERLSSDGDRMTIKQLVKTSAGSDKTVRRDLIPLRQLGFDVSETMEKFGRKCWRVPHPFQRLGKRQQYRFNKDSLEVLIQQAWGVGDGRLVADLAAIRKKVARKCGR